MSQWGQHSVSLTTRFLAATWSRLMAAFSKRYAEEWGKWGPRFERGRADGSRVLIRYTPIAR